ncbi:hypothetical protein L9Z41_04100 [Leptospira noguchii]|nr:hypothetical protein [Leptospira noguchii]MCH1910513.1 hypothetical protein [Leptospira noguchii]MCH1914847.1 hypothetical protein [Leptospira noguchii]UOG64758.1 hypothetical protein MAL04_04210 [Leptospira noguchii]
MSLHKNVGTTAFLNDEKTYKRQKIVRRNITCENSCKFPLRSWDKLLG